MFVYSTHKTREQAESALEWYFANGEISEAEQPKIETRRCLDRDDASKHPIVYCVMFPG